MDVRRMARVLLPLAWVNASLLSYGYTPYGVGIVVFGIVWLYVVWEEYYCLWPGLTHFCYHMAVRRMARALLPLAWVTSSLPSMAVFHMPRALLPVAWVTSSLLSMDIRRMARVFIAFGLG